MSRRISQLDGLRGLAALMVVVLHSFLVAPALGGGDRANLSPDDGWVWWLTSTPVAVLWNGGAAVLVFFVLSGYVLTLPFAKQTTVSSWVDYYPRRLVRLYVPVWGSVVFSLALFILIPRSGDPSYSWWINRHDVPLALKPLVADALLIRGTSWYNSPLWSLQYEVIFSLVLPLILLAVRRLQRGWVLLVIAMLVTVHVGENFDNGYLKYLPVFVIGVVLAHTREQLANSFERMTRGHWLLVVIASFTLMNPRLLPFATPNLAFVVLGATLMVIVFLGWTTAKELGDAPPVQWLGRRSFSLYLTHEPVIVSIAFATSWTHPGAILVAALPACLIVCDVFYRLVEAPSHRVSRIAGKFAVRTVARAQGKPNRSTSASDWPDL